jgi:hypothetical protein
MAGSWTKAQPCRCALHIAGRAFQIKTTGILLEDVVKKLSAALLGTVLISTALASAISPASALGGCGPNGHRNGAGVCVFGGQNQDWCLRKTGHVATRMPDGTLRCLR